MHLAVGRAVSHRLNLSRIYLEKSVALSSDWEMIARRLNVNVHQMNELGSWKVRANLAGLSCVMYSVLYPSGFNHHW